MGWLKQNNRGDTIVEVLLAITVVGMVLGGAYVAANRNLNATRRSQERAEAVRIAEGQIEYARAWLENYPRVHDTTLGYGLCFRNAFMGEEYDGAAQARPMPLPALDNDNFSHYSSSCRVSPAGGVTYHLVAAAQIDGPDAVNFAFHVRWDRFGGDGREEVVLRTRLYRGER